MLCKGFVHCVTTKNLHMAWILCNTIFFWPALIRRCFLEKNNRPLPSKNKVADKKKMVQRGKFWSANLFLKTLICSWHSSVSLIWIKVHQSLEGLVQVSIPMITRNISQWHAILQDILLKLFHLEKALKCGKYLVNFAFEAQSCDSINTFFFGQCLHAQ